MTLRIGDVVPDFSADSTHGAIRFHEWIDGRWAILFSHPKDFTPVCTTELGYVAALQPEFDARGCRIIGLGVDPVDTHHAWVRDIEATQGHAVTYPLIGDADLQVAKLFGMLPAEAQPGVRTAADNATVRTVIVIGPDRRVKATIAYPMSTGRNFHELLRLLDSLQVTARFGVATPVNWRFGDDVIIPVSVSDEEALARYPEGWTTLTPYLRIVAQPR